MLSLRLGSLLVLACTVAAQQPLHAQCGGFGWTGGMTCVSGAVCTKLNDHYFQCLPDSATPTTTTSTSAPTSSITSTTSSAPTSSSTSPANMSPEWTAAYTKAKAAVAKLSLTDKVNLATGVQWQRGNCVGNTPAISSISFPGLCLQDSPLGVRYADLVSAFTAGINVAATFNRTLMTQHGAAMGAEFRGKGVNVALGPMMNLMRAPAAGRNWEGFGGDPYLSGEAAFQVITGIQSQGVQATAKHYINNEQEHFRDSSSSNDRKMAHLSPNPFFLLKACNQQHEIYAAPFLRSVQANVAAVMCSYNQINGSYACENDKMLNGILKGEFGFPGYVMSDWWATHSTLSVNKGLDMTMPGDISLNSGTTYFGQALVNAVQSGSVLQSRIDDMALRILAAWYLLKQDSGFPAVNFNSWNLNAPVNTHTNVQADHKDVIRIIGASSSVLLKNANQILPLGSLKSIGIVGNGAGPSSKGPNGYSDRAGDDGVLAMGWGSGTAEFPYLITPLDAITTKAKTLGTTVSSSLSDTDLNAAANAASGKDVAIVFITADSGEGYLTVEGNAGDRNNLQAWHGGDALVSKVAGVNSKTIVVINSVGPIIMEPWINHPNVTAVVWSGLPGQEAGNAITDILYGAYNPSGRLPFTIGKSATDYAAQVTYNSNGGTLQLPYSEGLFVDYRYFDKSNIAPRFEFGFGLSYTTFQYSALSISGSTAGGTAPTGSALDPWLHTKVMTVTFSIQNTGTVAGHEVPQLYTTPPASTQSAPKNLKGFDSVYLTPGQTKTVTMQLSRYDLSFWNVNSQRWQVPTGNHGISIGASSRDIRLTGSLTV
ncbi:putative beta-glucosidase [Lyophyllum shimeji]|uniref:beta-glucosidase n=1 Tax=Lyophyllum shimeji TaxID=47721 RepID=A0A9P3UM50_LYOSH|nr:putative beta-glucosidase [Lyophyllum shimeji]